MAADAEAEAKADLDELPFIDPPKLEQLTSIAVVAKWAQIRSEEDILLEYRPAFRQCCLDLELMSKARVTSVLQFLDARMKADPIGGESEFDKLLERMIRRGYHLGDDVSKSAVRSQSCMIENFCIFSNLKAIYKAVGWRTKYFHAAMRECDRNMDDGDLISLLAAMTKGGHECIGRKRYAFNTMMDLVDPSKGQAEATGSLSRLGHAKQIIREYTELFLDEYKLKCFNAAFMEPIKIFERCIGGDDCQIGNATVHSCNVYAAVLLSTLGVQLPLQPYLDDNSDHGRHPFLDIKHPQFVAALEALAKPENLGRDSVGMKECKGFQLKGEDRLGTGFIFRGSTPRLISNAAIDPSEQNRTKREQLAPYLERFTAFFAADFVLEKLFNVLTQDRPDAMQTVYLEMKAGPLLAQMDPDELPDDYRYFLYDDETWEFDVDRAMLFFGFTGLLQPDCLHVGLRVRHLEAAAHREDERLAALEGKVSSLLGVERARELMPKFAARGPGRVPVRLTRPLPLSAAVPTPRGHTPFSWGADAGGARQRPQAVSLRGRLSSGGNGREADGANGNERRRCPRGHTPYSWGLGPLPPWRVEL